MSNIAGKAYAMNVIMPMEAWLTIVQRYIVTLCASLFNQFEFVQQQWTKYGGSFGAGNDTDPLIGLRRPRRKFVIPADAAGPHPPFICAELPSFVETRGGEHFFLPSLTALREIAI